MKEIKTQIEIKAAAQTVWQTLTDFAAYGTWNTFIPRIEGQPQASSKLKIMVTPPHGKRMSFNPQLIKVVPPKELRWQGSLWGLKLLFCGEHYFQIIPLSDHHVKLIHGEIFSGFLLPIVWKFIKEPIKMGYLQFNRDLKKECEL